jgi:hypothetical protein
MESFTSRFNYSNRRAFNLMEPCSGAITSAPLLSIGSPGAAPCYSRIWRYTARGMTLSAAMRFATAPRRAVAEFGRTACLWIGE